MRVVTYYNSILYICFFLTRFHPQSYCQASKTVYKDWSLTDDVFLPYEIMYRFLVVNILQQIVRTENVWLANDAGHMFVTFMSLR